MTDVHASAREAYTIDLPDGDAARLDQDAEWCVLRMPGQPDRRVRFHDYDAIFAVPGFYERLFTDELQCTSPGVVCDLLDDVLRQRGARPQDLRVLDVGAGNGMIGEELRERGFQDIVGVDIIPEARDAALRDRPDLYAEYHVVDLTDPPPEIDAALTARGFGCMTSVAALGFGDIPTDAFARSFNYVRDGGYVAFNLKDKFLQDDDPSGFNLLVRQLLGDGRMERVAERRYMHRLSAAGEPLHYQALVVRKTGDAPLS